MTDQESYEWRRNLLLQQMKKQTDQWLKDDKKIAKSDDLDPLPPKKGRKPKEIPVPKIDLNKPRNKFFNFD